MMRGETVYVEYKVATGADEYKETEYEVSERPVEGVLVAVGPTSSMVEASRPDGVTVAYTLYFPKPFAERLRGRRVKVRGEWFDVIGDPRPWSSPPSLWHMAAEVSTTYG